MAAEGIKTYECEDLTIIWDREKCVHAGMCWTGLPKVFRPRERPWIKIDNASPQEIIKVIDECPSGALSYRLKRGSPASPAQDKP
jgi:uncharacterized Fe-S cluster protein YjdI